MTGLALQYVFRQRPEVLKELGVVPTLTRPNMGLVGVFLIFCTAALFAVSVPALAGEKNPEAVASPPVAAESAAAAKAEPKPGFTGLDEAVNEKMSENAGLNPREPYINLESLGDVWNAALLLAGGTVGFILGRWWHLLFGSREPSALSVDQRAETT